MAGRGTRFTLYSVRDTVKHERTASFHRGAPLQGLRINGVSAPPGPLCFYVFDFTINSFRSFKFAPRGSWTPVSHLATVWRCAPIISAS